MNYFVPCILLLIFSYALIKKVPLFDSFVDGTREALKMVFNLIPYLLSIFLAIELMRVSGLSALIGRLMAPALGLFGIPKELSELLILRPISGSGSLVLLEQIFKDHQVDSYIARTASVIMGCNDTILYITAIYLSTSKDKKSGLAIPIGIFCSLLSAVVTAFICQFI